jgi:plastocyanin domain-containing protein
VRIFVLKDVLMKIASIENPQGLILEIGLAIALFVYLFWWRKKSSTPETNALQRIEVKLSGTFQPPEIRVLAGRPAQLLIHRFDQDPAEELFEIEALEIYELLPAFHTTIIAFQAEKRGSYPMILGGERKAGLLIVE